MTEFRTDPISGRQVLIAPGRAARPQPQRSDFHPGSEQDDPFLAGREHLTPPEVFAIRPDGSARDTPGWSVRVVPNRFPAVAADAQAGVASSPSRTSSLLPSEPAVGLHEVIVECPDFACDFAGLGVEQIERVLTAWRNRLRAIAADGRFPHAIIFKNSGTAAGASLAHCHSQLLAFGQPIPVVATEVQRCAEHWTRTGRSLFDDVIEFEVSECVRLVHRWQHVNIYCPFASRFPYENWLIPTTGGSHFHEAGDHRLQQTAAAVHAALTALAATCANPPYNMALHTAPLTADETPGFRWHLEIYPRIAGIAGFELGGGTFINPVSPEAAAQQLRERIANLSGDP